jgi:hypothetical protein
MEKRTILIAAFALTGALLTGCGEEEAPEEATTTNEAEVTETQPANNTSQEDQEEAAEPVSGAGSGDQAQPDEPVADTEQDASASNSTDTPANKGGEDEANVVNQDGNGTQGNAPANEESDANVIIKDGNGSQGNASANGESDANVIIKDGNGGTEDNVTVVDGDETGGTAEGSEAPATEEEQPTQ